MFCNGGVKTLRRQYPAFKKTLKVFHKPDQEKNTKLCQSPPCCTRLPFCSKLFTFPGCNCRYCKYIQASTLHRRVYKRRTFVGYVYMRHAFILVCQDISAKGAGQGDPRRREPEALCAYREAFGQSFKYGSNNRLALCS